MRPLVLLTGFGPFEHVEENPSGLLARRLGLEPPPGIEVVADVLPVSFARAPARLAELSAELGRPPALLLGLGLHHDPGFRVELRARADLTKAGRGDVDGVSAIDAVTPPGPDLWTTLEDGLRRFVDGRPGWWLSEEAGGYVCERLYRVQLELGRDLSCPALFLHVPALEHTDLEAQVREVGELLAALVG